MNVERIRTGGRGPLWCAIVPLAVLVPLAVTALVATVATRINATGGLLSVQAARTSGALYWVVNLGVIVLAAGAAYVSAAAPEAPQRLARVGVVRLLLGRWAWLALVAAACIFVEVVVVLLALPALFPQVYGAVSIGDAAGLRALWAMPLYAGLAVGIGVAVGTVLRSAGLAVGAVTVWALLIENALGVTRAQPWLPFLAGIAGTGQELALPPRWGLNGSLAYVAVVAVVCMAVGLVVLRWRWRR
ncbi:hypothetical protein ACUY3K_07055 [Corynebacterium uberis]|uniref:hypothetical protein n=1 Tax=Corynebacterium TaxID=1716 RepID=UPI001D0A7F2A|nr:MULTISPECIES: hypothetical protein [Corynebacterium]MCZ9310290.1 hypothetical protein [Corynebacterium sp. c6VSa_13]UDL73641.1 hypothetical protein LH391_11300 [Corynebacterium uberis]UDL75479.1 hypothetical protein LH393_09625 [Corynebacterium uberis]UDL77692.1 hypothetical protein LH394_09610 [Corynebacterium uberis]UDL79976.1 hypothetical protein LH392_10035 [Corynebacterium uberis]